MNLHRVYAVTRAIWEASGNPKALRISRKAKRRLKRQNPYNKIRQPASGEAMRKRCHIINHHISRGSFIVALDCEWTMTRPLTEVGLAIYHRGEFQHRNICILPDERQRDQFLFGATEYLTLGEARAEMRELSSRVELLIGHALKNDRKQLSRFGGVPEFHDVAFDTETFSTWAYHGERHKLKYLARRAGFDAKSMHCAGNDAAMTLFIALALVGRREECRVPQHEIAPDFYRHLS